MIFRDKGNIRKVIKALLFGALLSACSPANSTTPLIPVTLQLNAAHGAQAAGFYAAVANGDYAAEGLNVTFLEGGLNIDTVASVLDGSAQFGVLAGDVLLLARAAGKPIRAVATIQRREPFVFFSLADSGITRPEDFVGKKILVSDNTRPRLYAMLGKVGLTPDQVTQVTQVATTDFTGLYTGALDVAGGTVTNTVLQAQRAGYKVNIIYPDDYGLHFYSTSIFASDDTIAANPDLVTRFLRASFKGWTYAVENPVAAGSLVLKYNPNVDKDLELAKLVASLPFVNTGEDHIGWMKPEIWEGMERTLRDQGVLTAPLDAADVYTLKFIQQIYGEGSP